MKLFSLLSMIPFALSTSISPTASPTISPTALPTIAPTVLPTMSDLLSCTCYCNPDNIITTTTSTSDEQYEGFICQCYCPTSMN